MQLHAFFYMVKNMSIAQLDKRQVILFDLDGTLVDSAADLHRAMNISLAELGLALVTQEQVRCWIGKGSAIFCHSVLEYLTTTVDQAQHQLLLQTFLRVYNAEPCVMTHAFPGVIEFLTWAKAQHKTLLCVTNKPEQPAREILQQLDMQRYFDDVIGGDRFEQRKPHPRQLLHCMQHYALQAQQLLMIGDSSNDVEAARRAGVDCIVVSYGYNHGESILSCHPQQVVDNLMMLLE